LAVPQSPSQPLPYFAVHYRGTAHHQGIPGRPGYPSHNTLCHRRHGHSGENLHPQLELVRGQSSDSCDTWVAACPRPPSLIDVQRLALQEMNTMPQKSCPLTVPDCGSNSQTEPWPNQIASVQCQRQALPGPLAVGQPLPRGSGPCVWPGYLPPSEPFHVVEVLEGHAHSLLLAHFVLQPLRSHGALPLASNAAPLTEPDSESRTQTRTQRTQKKPFLRCSGCSSPRGSRVLAALWASPVAPGSECVHGLSGGRPE
jgi:hypothetical protein